MKIEIMSMQRVINYGSFLQAYGLKSIIKSLGYEAEFVDFKTENVETSNNKKITDIIVKGVRFLSHRSTKTKRKLYKKASIFEKTFSSYFPILGFDEKYSYNTETDLLIVGSDEVFNCFQLKNNQVLSYDLFGKDCKAKNIVSYAASYGSSKYERFVEAGIDKEIGELLNRFTYLSVRDNNSKENTELLSGRKDVNMHLDPVLMYEFNEEIVVPQTTEPYIVVYAYRGRISPEEGKRIKAFAKKKKMKLYCIGGVLDFCDDFILASPFEVLGWMKNASYIITDTFHGTIFSIKYGVKFASIIRDNNREKLYDLLYKFDLTHREVTNIEKLEEIVDREIDVEKTEKLIKEERTRTIEYLKKCIDTCSEKGE